MNQIQTCMRFAEACALINEKSPNWAQLRITPEYLEVQIVPNYVETYLPNIDKKVYFHGGESHIVSTYNEIMKYVNGAIDE